MMSATLDEIVAALGGRLVGDGARRVERIAPLTSAASDAITFLAQARLRAQLDTTLAACVIVTPALEEAAVARGVARGDGERGDVERGQGGGHVIVTDDPYAYYARLSQWWARRQRGDIVPDVHATAVVDPGAVIDPTASIGPQAVVEHGARIGAHAVIGPLCFVGAGASVGDDTRLAARVHLAQGCSIGARGIVHAGAVIGADGFGFAPEGAGDAHRWIKIEQLGGVRIGDDVEIGANTCIDRGALDDTVIEDGVKLDNLIQIGHNVRIGAHTAIAGNTGVAGSTRIGAHCMIAGAANIIGHLEIADHVTITVATTVTRSIREPGIYSGAFPMDDNASWERNAATLRRLHELRERVKTLERRLEKPTQKNTP
jgi:UDP-3-O-[3-hydroxymyristoyl] glucosamine N-acyltransferase